MDKRPLRRTKPVTRTRNKSATYSIFGFEVSMLGLLVGGGSVILVVGLLVFLLGFTRVGSLFASRPDSRAVDIFTAINGMGYTKVGERFLQSKTTSMKIPGPSQIVVIRDNPAGQYLVMKVRISNAELDDHYKGVTSVILSTSQVLLQSGGETLEPLLIQADCDPDGPQLSYSPPAESTGGKSLADYIGPGKEKHNSWTHEGSMTRSGGNLVFKGKGGMEVRVETGAERQDGKKGGNILGDVIGGDAGKGLDESGLVAAPSGYIRVTCNSGCGISMAGYDVERPIDLRLGWDVYCIFPRPKSGEKEATLLVLGKSRKIKLP